MSDAHLAPRAGRFLGTTAAAGGAGHLRHRAPPAPRGHARGARPPSPGSRRDRVPARSSANTSLIALARRLRRPSYARPQRERCAPEGDAPAASRPSAPLATARDKSAGLDAEPRSSPSPRQIPTPGRACRRDLRGRGPRRAAARGPPSIPRKERTPSPSSAPSPPALGITVSASPGECLSGTAPTSPSPSARTFCHAAGPPRRAGGDGGLFKQAYDQHREEAHRL